MEDNKSQAKRKEGRERERATRIKRKSEPYEKITNGEKQIELRAKMEKNGEKGKRARTWTKKHKARPRDRDWRKKWRG